MKGFRQDVHDVEARLSTPRNRPFSLARLASIAATGGLLLAGYHYSLVGNNGFGGLPSALHRSAVADFQKCAIDNLLNTGLPFLENVSPITLTDFEERRDRLANALVAERADAFVVEPGYTFKYYGNVSQPEWEVWEVCCLNMIEHPESMTDIVAQPEERPFLMVVRPQQDEESGKITANTTFLCPSFEAERARLLGMPFAKPIQIVRWEEHWNPYTTLQQSGVFGDLYRVPRLMVDEEMRDFIQRGLATAGFDVVGLQGRVEEVRQSKSEKEVEILRAVNTGTVEAVRQVRKCELVTRYC